MRVLEQHTGCYGPAELETMGLVFDELWSEMSPHFESAGDAFIERVRNRLAMDVLALPTLNAAEMKLRARDAFLLRFPIAA